MSVRDEAAKSRLELAESVFPVICVTPVFPGFAEDTTPLAKELLKPNTKEMYETCEWQHTVWPLDGHGLSDVLNDDGVTLYAKVLVKVNQHQFKDTISDYQIDYKHSGMWVADKSSPFHDESEQCNGCLNSFNNKAIVGISKTHSKYITTSPCIFITPNWCYTKSGSLYKLENQG